MPYILPTTSMKPVLGFLPRRLAVSDANLSRDSCKAETDSEEAMFFSSPSLDLKFVRNELNSLAVTRLFGGLNHGNSMTRFGFLKIVYTRKSFIAYRGSRQESGKGVKLTLYCTPQSFESKAWNLLDSWPVALPTAWLKGAFLPEKTSMNPRESSSVSKLDA